MKLFVETRRKFCSGFWMNQKNLCRIPSGDTSFEILRSLWRTIYYSQKVWKNLLIRVCSKISNCQVNWSSIAIRLIPYLRVTQSPRPSPGKSVVDAGHPEKGWFCHQLIINEGFESRARKFAKRRFFLTFVIITKEPQRCGQLKEPWKKSDAALLFTQKFKPKFDMTFYIRGTRRLTSAVISFRPT